MKKYLISNEGNFYKANLHMHTTVSDGKLTPEETKEAYMANGYSIVAFTDHEVMVAHEDLTDENFVAITSVEFSVGKGDGLPWQYGGTQVYHINFYAKDPKNVISSAFSERFVVFKNSLPYVTDDMRRYDDNREYSVEYINDAIRRAKEEGFLVSYNHPVWSLQNYKDYADLEGVWGVEVYNTGCVKTGYRDTVQPLDDFLKQNKQVFPLATDDAHSPFDHFGGWVMLKMKKLDYPSVIEAMEKGEFYASTGPAIKELSIEDGVVTVACSKAVEITLSTGRRFSKTVLANEGEYLEGAQLDIKAHLERCQQVVEVVGDNPYIRITVKDEKGDCAYTRAYFYNELI